MGRDFWRLILAPDGFIRKIVRNSIKNMIETFLTHIFQKKIENNLDPSNLVSYASLCDSLTTALSDILSKAF